MEHGWTYQEYLSQPEWFIAEMLAVHKERDLESRRAAAGKKPKGRR